MIPIKQEIWKLQRERVAGRKAEGGWETDPAGSLCWCPTPVFENLLEQDRRGESLHPHWVEGKITWDPFPHLRSADTLGKFS